ncbi:hypothetical protein F2Q70_00012244 [Brassica cretica]|uniref:Uncharacterized protein n=1 Tax=Brassica cretica TaxID=69181 RepID=A0A8S9M1P9_BRACR|nr:hypothetical protein F2Q70_00012244 [Brassica cretica]
MRDGEERERELRREKVLGFWSQTLNFSAIKIFNHGSLASGRCDQSLSPRPVFHHMVCIFHSFKGFSDLEDFWDDLPVSRLKYNVLEDFQYDLPRSLLTESLMLGVFKAPKTNVVV